MWLSLDTVGFLSVLISQQKFPFSDYSSVTLMVPSKPDGRFTTQYVPSKWI